MKGYVEIALAHGVDEERWTEVAADRLARVPIAELFGIGYTITKRVASRARVLLSDYPSPLFDDDDRPLLEALTMRRPRLSHLGVERAIAVVEFLEDMARRHERRLMVRLVKGAYWDTEVKHAQELGFDGYPVFTRKASTDVSYLACAKRLLGAPDAFYAQFATHNAHTLASILHYAGSRRDYEFQRLHGMGEELYAEIVDEDKFDRPCRVYAPVGSHEDLLPYLVRRLLGRDRVSDRARLRGLWA